jgi:predicted DNA-binding protein
MGTIVIAKKTGIEREIFSTRLMPSLIRRLKIYAATEGRHIHEVIEEALEGYLENSKKKKKSYTSRPHIRA